ncbi:MAG: alpha-L-arabinofuranosidase C-terminal domain-containing protein [Verrucomicrobiia bacterium]
MKKYSLIILWAFAISLQAAVSSSKITVQADKQLHQISPILWGIFFEDINLSADGGIYPEQVRNRSFEDSDRPVYWEIKEYGNARGEISIDSSRPLNPFNRKSLRLRINQTADNGSVCVINNGYWGISAVAGEEYNFSLAARCADGFGGNLKVELVGQAGQTLASAEITGIGNNWKNFSLTIKPTATDHKASLIIRANQRGTVWLDMVSLIPKKTFKGHGLREDICQMLADLKPSFVRFPGGCWVEGDDMAHMYNWKKTIGDIAHRTPLWNLWQYWATHGLGFYEYLQLCEDLNAEPLFCINIGMSHREVVPMDQMGQWVQDALDSIEFANGSPNSVWGSQRARMGHPNPFNMKLMEIGNENGGPAYNERWPLFYKAIKERMPEMKLVADVWGGYPRNPMPDIIDEHYYNSAEFFIRHFNHYDNYDRKGPKIFVGEYAVTSGCGNGNLRAAIGEAVFMTGIERNSDIVVMASYAPLLANVNHKRWNPDLIYFDNHRVFGTPSYYVQKMFSENRGDYVLPVEIESQEATSSPRGGTIGVGTWLTQAEYKDIKVTENGKVVFESDFAKGTDGWKFLGDGDWSVKDGALAQGKIAENVRAIVTGKKFTEYTLTLKARKISGAEGFLILFNVNDENEKAWWNIGGWGNRSHGIEMGGIIGNQVPGRIETGKWYDIKIEVTRDRIKCYLDGKLIHDAGYPVMKSLYGSASLVSSTKEVILKVVNVSFESQTSEIVVPGKKIMDGELNAITLTSEKATDENSFDEPTKVSPKPIKIQVKSNTISHTFPANSLTIIRIP